MYNISCLWYACWSVELGAVLETCARCNKLSETDSKAAPADTHELTQVVMVEEYMQDGRNKRATLAVQLRGPMQAGLFIFGDTVEVTGITRVRQLDNGRTNIVYMQSLFTCKQSPLARPLPSKFVHFLAELKRMPNPLALLVNSIAPAVISNQLLKLGLLLSIVGGSARNYKDPRDPHINSPRGSIHVLVLSQKRQWLDDLLHAVTQLSANGQLVQLGAITSFPREQLGVPFNAERSVGGAELGHTISATAIALRHQGTVCIARQSNRYWI
jgi:DNA replicative helicase MCM subunit Mcm2 (Cdc46/Mcm family)